MIIDDYKRTMGGIKAPEPLKKRVVSVCLSGTQPTHYREARRNRIRRFVEIGASAAVILCVIVAWVALVRFVGPASNGNNGNPPINPADGSQSATEAETQSDLSYSENGVAVSFRMNECTLPGVTWDENIVYSFDLENYNSYHFDNLKLKWVNDTDNDYFLVKSFKIARVLDDGSLTTDGLTEVMLFEEIAIALPAHGSANIDYWLGGYVNGHSEPLPFGDYMISAEFYSDSGNQSISGIFSKRPVQSEGYDTIYPGIPTDPEILGVTASFVSYDKANHILSLSFKPVGITGCVTTGAEWYLSRKLDNGEYSILAKVDFTAEEFIIESGSSMSFAFDLDLMTSDVSDGVYLLKKSFRHPNGRFWIEFEFKIENGELTPLDAEAEFTQSQGSKSDIYGLSFEFADYNPENGELTLNILNFNDASLGVAVQHAWSLYKKDPTSGEYSLFREDDYDYDDFEGISTYPEKNTKKYELGELEDGESYRLEVNASCSTMPTAKLSFSFSYADGSVRPGTN